MLKKSGAIWGAICLGAFLLTGCPSNNDKQQQPVLPSNPKPATQLTPAGSPGFTGSTTTQQTTPANSSFPGNQTGSSSVGQQPTPDLRGANFQSPSPNIMAPGPMSNPPYQSQMPQTTQPQMNPSIYQQPAPIQPQGFQQPLTQPQPQPFGTNPAPLQYQSPPSSSGSMQFAPPSTSTPGFPTGR
jgi:hypothetical protein